MQTGKHKNALRQCKKKQTSRLRRAQMESFAHSVLSVDFLKYLIANCQLFAGQFVIIAWETVVKRKMKKKKSRRDEMAS